MVRGDRWEERVLVWLGVSLFGFMQGLQLSSQFLFVFPDRPMDLSCKNAKGMKIKVQILKENTEMLPENEMSVLTDYFKLHATLKTVSQVVTTIAQHMLQLLTKGCTQQRSLTPTVQNQKLYYSEFIKYYLLFTFYSFYFSLLLVVLLDVMVFTQVVRRVEQKQC